MPVCLSESLSIPLSESRSITLVSCRETNLKGSGVNKRKASPTKLKRGIGRRAGSGAVCAHKELSVRMVELHILGGVLRNTHTDTLDRDSPHS